MREEYGVVLFVSEPKQVSERLTVKRIGIEQKFSSPKGEYENYLVLQAGNKKIEELHGIYPGMKVKFSFFVQGRLYEKDGRQDIFITLNLNKIEVIKEKGYTNRGENVYGRDDDDVADGGVVTGGVPLADAPGAPIESEDDLPF